MLCFHQNIDVSNWRLPGLVCPSSVDVVKSSMKTHRGRCWWGACESRSFVHCPLTALPGSRIQCDAIQCRDHWDWGVYMIAKPAVLDSKRLTLHMLKWHLQATKISIRIYRVLVILMSSFLSFLLVSLAYRICLRRTNAAMMIRKCEGFGRVCLWSIHSGVGEWKWDRNCCIQTSEST